MRVNLASKSPRRRELLQQIDVDYRVLDIDIDESWKNHEAPIHYVCRIAAEKARAGRALSENNDPILAADTAVVLAGDILGKAESRGDVVAMLTKLSGKTHEVLSAVTVIDKEEQTKLSISKVYFKQLSVEEIETYADTDEPVGKAGGYAIQGKAAIFIQKIEGSYSGVMGLPLFETQQLLNAIR